MMWLKNFDKRPNEGLMAAAYTGIFFLLVLKILRGFAVKSAVSAGFVTTAD
jgi:Na+-transporting methylmalonyl-CoA/oxaloacetate decarboxylase beta subunit